MSRAVKIETGGRTMFGEWVDDGYEFMELAAKSGWRAISAWGSDGWDLGNWPYVMYFFRDADGTFQRACYCEGDITVETYATAEDRQADTDETALFYWVGKPWAEGLTRETPAEMIPDHLRGPFSWARTAA